MKKLNKFFAVLVALAMMAMLSVTAFAIDETAVEDEIAVTKQLNVSNDIAKEDLSGTVTINFNFVSATGSAASNTPQVESFTKNITISAANVKAEVPGDASTAYYFTTGTIDAEDFGLDATTMAPGVYKYNVTETVTNVTANKVNEEATGSETSKTYVLTVLKDKDGDLTFTASYDDQKITINPGQTGENIKGNGLAFKNNLYDVLGDEETTYENSAFKMKKTVTDTANLYQDEKFEFTYTIVLPEGATAADVTAYKVVDGTETEVTSIDFTGANNTVSLGNGDYLYFKTIPAGSLVRAWESDTTNTADAANAGKNFYTTNRGMTEADTLEADGQAAEVTNISVAETTMEGILHNSIPYIVLALVAIGGMVAYVVVRRRNADEA